MRPRCQPSQRDLGVGQGPDGFVLLQGLVTDEHLGIDRVDHGAPLKHGWGGVLRELFFKRVFHYSPRYYIQTSILGVLAVRTKIS